MDSAAGARQVITFDPPIQHPFRISGWSRAQDADVQQDYNLYLDVHYADGTPLWGQIAYFRPGTHDWEYAEHVFDPAKPVRSISVYAMFRKATGTVWFDDLKLELLPLEFKDLRVLGGLYGPRSLAVAGGLSLPGSWEARLESPAGVLVSATGQRPPVRLDWARAAATPEGKAATQSAGGGPLTLVLKASDPATGQTIEQRHRVSTSPDAPARDYAVWTDSSMHRVLPFMLPDRVDLQPKAEIALAGNEYESFQVLLRTGDNRPLRQVRIEVEDLVCTQANTRIPAANVQWQQVGYVRLEKLFRHPAYVEAQAGWWPDPLLPVTAFDVEGGFTQSVWVTVLAPAGTPTGEYTGALTVRPEGRPAARVEIRCRVYGFALDTRGHLKTAFALMDGFLERVYGRPLPPELRRRYGEFLLRHRLNPDDISRTDMPALEDIKHYGERGLNAFNVLNMVQDRGKAAWVCYSEKDVYTPQFKEQLIRRLDPYVQQLRAAGLADRAYVYTFDEREKDFYPIIREYFGMIKQRYGLPTMTTAKVPQDPAVMRDLNVDWNCPLTAVYRYEDAQRCRQAGLQVWAYVCLGPRYPYANWLADDPLIEARVLGWQAYHQQMDGLLYWGVNIWDGPHNDKPIDPRKGPLLDWSITTGGEYAWLHGDGRLIYAGADGPIGSIRLANIRDGLDDYEYLWRLARQSGDVETARKACTSVTTSLTRFTRDPAAVYAAREAVAGQIKAR